MPPKGVPQTPGVRTRAMRRAAVVAASNPDPSSSSSSSSSNSNIDNNNNNVNNNNNNDTGSSGNGNGNVDELAGHQLVKEWIQHQEAARSETILEVIEYQAIAGAKRLCKRPRVLLGAFVATIWLVNDMLCSAGPICKFYPRWYLWYFYAQKSFPELAAICGTYLLFIFGICNAFEGAAKMIENIGRRLARRPVEMRTWAIPTDTREYARTNLSPLVLDATNLIIEPLLLVALTVSFKEFLPFGSGPERAFITSFLLHFIKWCCQAADYIFIERTHRPSWRPVCFAVFGVMSLILLHQNRELLSFPPPSEAAEAHWHSRGYPSHGSETKFNLGGWNKKADRSVAGTAFTITRYLVTSGITPTVSASGT